MRRRQEPRRKRQSNFPRKEERFLGLALRMPSRRGLPGHSPGSLGRKAKEPASLPPSPDRTGVSLGFFAYPPTQALEHIPLAPPISPISALFPFRYSYLLPPRSCGSPPSLSEAPLPCCCTRFPLAPWHPLNSQLAPPMSVCSSVPTTLAQSCLGSSSRGPPAPAPGGALVLGTPGCLLRVLPGSRGGSGSSLRHTRCPWAAGG